MGVGSVNANAQAFFDNTLDAAPILPVKFLSFSAIKQEGDVNLSWITATETNNSHFNVERSYNGIDFQYIGKVAGKGNTVAETKYSYSDNKVPNLTIYYRLKQFDLDGTATISTVAVIKSERGNSPSIGVYPNPVRNNTISLSFENVPTGKYTITLIGLNGSRLYQQNIEHNVPTEVIQLFLLSKPAKGVYILNTNNGMENKSQKIIIE
jgi:hypothetical protein